MNLSAAWVFRSMVMCDGSRPMSSSKLFPKTSCATRRAKATPCTASSDSKYLEANCAHQLT